MKEIVNVMAVFQDDTNRIARFDEMTNFVFYTRKDSNWQKSDEIPCKPDLSGGMAAIRENIHQMINVFNNCRIIITKSLTGIPYQVFDKAGFIICESKDFDLELLDTIQSDLVKIDSETKKDELLLSNTPKETALPGHYFIDLTQVQKKHPEMSSKMVLLPFLKDTPFYSLEVVSDHIPPWFEHKLSELNFSYTIQNKNDSAQHVIITHIVCE